MRGPCQEHDRLPGPVGPFDLREHALLARLDQLETAKAKLILPDQLEDDVVAVVAGLDAVELSRKAGNKAGVLPYTLLLDRSGTIAASLVGGITEARMRAELARLL